MSNQKQQDKIIVSGVVTQALPDTSFRVKLDSGKEILAYLSGRMKVNYVRVIPGDRVKLEISRYDLTKGRIIYREK